LGVRHGADADEIKRAYRKLARQYHPDAGGDAEDFKKLQEAYEALGEGGKANKSRTSSAGQGAGAKESQTGGYHSERDSTQEQMRYEKPTKQRVNLDGRHFSWIDKLSPEERNRYRLLNRLAREAGHEEPYPEANEETFKEYYERSMAELTAELEAIRCRQAASGRQHGSDSGQRTQSESTTDRRHQSTEERGQYLTGGLYKKQNSIGDWYMVDSTGNRVGYSYKDLKTLRRFVIGTNAIGSEILIDPETGQELSRQYSKIRTESLHLVGVNSIGSEILLDPATGQELSRQFSRIKTLGRHLIGTNSIGSEILLDKNTGHELSRQYNSIRTEGRHLVGVNSIGGEILLDPETGQELSRQFKRIRFVGTGYEGETFTGRVEMIRP
jgi:curved DNA-binding protein CbpA